MNRREFLPYAAALLAAGATALAAEARRRVGLQLFSIPKILEKDFREGIAFIAGLGYTEVEPFGPYPFSDPKAIARWKSLTPQLGFSGSGFFGLSAAQVRSILGEHHMTAPAMHTDLATLQTRMGALAEAAHALGASYVILPAIPAENRKTLDDFKRMADSFNSIGDQARRDGLKFAYHNHGYGLQEMQGQIPLELLLRQTDPALVFFEMDVYWTAAGGGDPVELLKAHPTRYKLLHLKDMKERQRFKGDGGDPSQWMALFPYMTSVGDGVLDIKAIVAQGRRNGVEHFFVEQDGVADPQLALRRSADFLLKLQ
jgi:sugar phosphate isomerase/epimerase